MTRVWHAAYFLTTLFTFSDPLSDPLMMDYLGKGEVLTNTDLDRFVNNIWAFCVHRKKSYIFEFSSWKMVAKVLR